MGKIKWHTSIHCLLRIDTQRSESSNDAAFRPVMDTRSLSTHHIQAITLRVYCRSARQAQKATCKFSITSWNLINTLKIFFQFVSIHWLINSFRNLQSYLKGHFNNILLRNCVSYNWNISSRFPNNISLVSANPFYFKQFFNIFINCRAVLRLNLNI